VYKPQLIQFSLTAQHITTIL